MYSAAWGGWGAAWLVSFFPPHHSTSLIGAQDALYGGRALACGIGLLRRLDLWTWTSTMAVARGACGRISASTVLTSATSIDEDLHSWSNFCQRCSLTASGHHGNQFKRT